MKLITNIKFMTTENIISIIDLEKVINYWRTHNPVINEGCTLSHEVNELASIYAMMIYEHVNVLNLAKIEINQHAIIDTFRHID